MAGTSPTLVIYPSIYLSGFCCRHPANWPRGNIIVRSSFSSSNFQRTTDLIVVRGSYTLPSLQELTPHSRTFVPSLKVKLRILLSGSPPRHGSGKINGSTKQPVAEWQLLRWFGFCSEPTNVSKQLRLPFHFSLRYVSLRETNLASEVDPKLMENIHIGLYLHLFNSKHCPCHVTVN